MNLSDLLGDDDVATVVARLHGAADREVTSVTQDSRNVGAGGLFVCVPGAQSDGHDHAQAAVNAGAVALVVERGVEVDGDVTIIEVGDARRASGLFAAAFHGHPSKSMKVVGITGTNGKTTTTHLVAQILEHSGLSCGIIGTLSGVRTTPDGPSLQKQLAELRGAGRAAVAMEVSSHALDQQRVVGTRFAAAVFTNLTQDHLDYHGTMDAYFAAKAKLFTPELADIGIVNQDDPWGRRLMDMSGVPTLPYTIADADELELRPTGSTFVWRGAKVEVALAGDFNVSNSLAAATVCEALGVPVADIAAGIQQVHGVSGRVEAVNAGQQFTVVVDYAHTPDGLEKVLGAMRNVLSPRGRLIVVFGCGGDRDRAKRPMMGEVAARIADRSVITSDNPRSEDPLAIIEEIRGGVAKSRDESVVIEADRAAAIRLAVGMATDHDIVVIAGKGHETGQTVGDETRPFDDRLVASQAIQQLRVTT
jgi:UDP-N-acetylmuramoyl-L-alanyl-D-glutamate--2,6-diaminopimelate ligase